MMPEAPEVQTVLETLRPRLEGKQIVSAAVTHPKLAANLDVHAFEHKLEGEHITGFDRKGKYLVLQTDHHDWVIHLRMEGKLYVLPEKPDPANKHVHALFCLDDGSCLVYQDTRKFGRMYLYDRTDDVDSLPVLQKVGPDLLKGLDEGEMETVMPAFKKKKAVKSILLDQSVASGIGNIYADEILFSCGIHPETPGKDLTEHQVRRLLETAHSILQEAAAHKGTTIRTYTSSPGVHGNHQDALQVHMKEGEPCPVCGTPLEKMRVSQRSTYLCPHCQKR